MSEKEIILRKIPASNTKGANALDTRCTVSGGPRKEMRVQSWGNVKHGRTEERFDLCRD